MSQPVLFQLLGVHGDNRWLVPLFTGPLVLAPDHDFHLNGILPSVVFVMDVPKDPLDTLFETIHLSEVRIR